MNKLYTSFKYRGGGIIGFCLTSTSYVTQLRESLYSYLKYLIFFSSSSTTNTKNTAKIHPHIVGKLNNNIDPMSMINNTANLFILFIIQILVA